MPQEPKIARTLKLDWAGLFIMPRRIEFARVMRPLLSFESV